jgi:hypothetical protein
MECSLTSSTGLLLPSLLLHHSDEHVWASAHSIAALMVRAVATLGGLNSRVWSLRCALRLPRCIALPSAGSSASMRDGMFDRSLFTKPKLNAVLCSTALFKAPVPACV